MESFYWKKTRKNLTESAATTEAISQIYHTMWESTESTSPEPFFYFLCQKSYRSPEDWMGTKLIELRHSFLDQKSCQIKNHLKPRGFSLLWKLANKSHLKKHAIFFICKCNPPRLQNQLLQESTRPFPKQLRKY